MAYCYFSKIALLKQGPLEVARERCSGGAPVAAWWWLGGRAEPPRGLGGAEPRGRAAEEVGPGDGGVRAEWRKSAAGRPGRVAAEELGAAGSGGRGLQGAEAGGCRRRQAGELGAAGGGGVTGGRQHGVAKGGRAGGGRQFPKV
ncbi:uncharacterized protein LOC131051029 [Cryptomeria japonica]|uniref:uncharacterized protein LOC131051029 n=1 Tax=Cryptomeria japonica TaxID=3369 RepID=UPI0027DA3ADB|nr:uncharacterized protein LOC131051029 [Cryptomeria japonica]